MRRCHRLRALRRGVLAEVEAPGPLRAHLESQALQLDPGAGHGAPALAAVLELDPPQVGAVLHVPLLGGDLVEVRGLPPEAAPAGGQRLDLGDADGVVVGHEGPEANRLDLVPQLLGDLEPVDEELAAIGLQVAAAPRVLQGKLPPGELQVGRDRAVAREVAVPVGVALIAVPGVVAGDAHPDGIPQLPGDVQVQHPGAAAVVLRPVSDLGRRSSWGARCRWRAARLSGCGRPSR